MTVDIVFSILNFALLIGLFAYIFFRFFYPQFSQKIAADREQRKELETQRNGCAARLVEVEREREQREEMYRALVRKVADWRRCIEEREEQFEREQQLRNEKTRARVQQQEMALIAQHRWVQVVPQAIAKARLELYDHFHGGEAGSCYIDQLVKDVERYHGHTE